MVGSNIGPAAAGSAGPVPLRFCTIKACTPTSENEVDSKFNAFNQMTYLIRYSTEIPKPENSIFIFITHVVWMSHNTYCLITSPVAIYFSVVIR